MPNAGVLIEDPLIKRAFEWATVELADEGNLTAKAPRIPMVVIISMELMVVDVEKNMVLRIMAWVRLVKLYASLRSDDLQRLRPAAVALRDSGLVGTLTRTKTTGVGRRVKELPLFVPKGAFMACPAWLEVGYNLWAAGGDDGRDFFLHRPSPDLQGFTKHMASMGELGALGLAVLAGLRVPVRRTDGDREWSQSDEALLPEPLASGWTSHSERSTVSSALAAIGVPKESRNILGRWSPSGSDDYVRTHRAMVKELLLRFTSTVGAGRSYDSFDEEEAIEDVRIRVMKRGYVGLVVDPLIKSLKENAARICKDCGGAETLASPTEVASLPTLEGFGDMAPDSEAEGPPAKYMVVYTRGRKIARLHKVDGCWLARRKSFQDFELIAVEPPPRELYNKYCANCWPLHGTEVTVGAQPGENSDDEETSSASSTSTGADPS